ncbi:MAG: hypothetical protein MK171_07610 [Pirellulales bacterium]|nr:hypothetical protein [Pirellulales bacterium]
MQACLCVVGMLLAAQLSGADSDRYSWSESDAAERSTGADIYPAAPATNTRPEPKALPLPRKVSPAQLLVDLAKRGSSFQLQGIPLTLSDALAGASSRSEQSKCVGLYWQLANSVLTYNLAEREDTELAMLQDGVLPAGRVWQDAGTKAKDTIQTDLQTVRVLQYRLQKKLRRSGKSTLPLPSDLPHARAYETRYGDLFGDRQSGEAAELNRLLELEYSSLTELAGQVEASRGWLDRVRTGQSPQSDGADLLQAYQSFARSRRLFLQAVSDYNNNIARYTELATPERVDTQRLVAMLIKTKSLGENRRGDQAIWRTSAEQPADVSGLGREAPRTYAEPERITPQRIGPSESTQDRSILVD